MPSILLINGPNLNLLGTREPDIYGTTTLQEVEETCRKISAQHDVTTETFRSNHEGQIVDRIQQGRGKVDFIIINPAAFTHTSVALRDALAAVSIPYIEVHITNVYARESFRRHSYLSDKAVGCIIGLGTFGYEAAVQSAILRLKSESG